MDSCSTFVVLGYCLKTESVSAVLLSVSFVLFSFGIPLIQQKADNIKNDMNEAQFHHLQSEINKLISRYNTDLANILSVFAHGSNSDRLIDLFRHHARENLMFAIIGLHFVLNFKPPSDEQVIIWRQMDFAQLQTEEDRVFKLGYSVRTLASKKLRVYNNFR